MQHDIIDILLEAAKQHEIIIILRLFLLMILVPLLYKLFWPAKDGTIPILRSIKSFKIGKYVDVKTRSIQGNSSPFFDVPIEVISRKRNNLNLNYKLGEHITELSITHHNKKNNEYYAEMVNAYVNYKNEGINLRYMANEEFC